MSILALWAIVPLLLALACASHAVDVCQEKKIELPTQVYACLIGGGVFACLAGVLFVWLR